MRRIAAAMIAAAALIGSARAAFPQDTNRTLMGLLQQQYKIAQPPECLETDVSVGTTALRVGLNDPAAFFVVFFNLGTSNCYRSALPSVTTTTGQLTPANGGFLEFDFKTDGVIPAQEQWFVCSGAGNNIHMQRCALR